MHIDSSLFNQNTLSARRGLSGLLLAALLMLAQMAHANFAVPASYFNAEPGQLSYYAMGKGHHTVLLLGGGPGFSSWNLTPIQHHLSADYRVLLMDMRGIGSNKQHTNKQHSDKHPTDKSQLLEQWVADIEALRRHEQAGQLILIGHSWGALMAQYYARAHPHRTHRMIFINPVDPELHAMRHLVEKIEHKRQQHFPQDPLSDQAFEQTFEQAIQSRETSLTALAERQLTQVLPIYFYNFQQGQAYAQQFSAADLEIDINHAAWQSYRDNPIRAENLQYLAQKRALALIGCDQDLLMPENLQAYQQILPDLSSYQLNSCVHFPWEEQPQAFYRALDQAIVEPIPQDDFSDLSEAERAWLEDDSELIALVDALDSGRSELRFVEPFALDDHYAMFNHLELSASSLQDGWLELEQCHHNLDPVAKLQIVYNAEHTRDLEIIRYEAVGEAWVEDHSVQINQLQRGAKLCIRAQTRALQKLDTDTYRLTRGPFMRQFFDSFYPMHVELTLQASDFNLEIQEITPFAEQGMNINQTPQTIRLGYWFQGILKPQIDFKATAIKH